MASYLLGEPLGITRPHQPSLMQLRWCVGVFGSIGVFACRHFHLTSKKCTRICSNACSKRCVIQLERFQMDKVQVMSLSRRPSAPRGRRPAVRRERRRSSQAGRTVLREDGDTAPSRHPTGGRCEGAFFATEESRLPNREMLHFIQHDITNLFERQ